MKTTLTTLLSVLVLSACVGIGAGGSRSWKEQVILPNGQELIVERSHTLGNRFDRELSAINAPPGATDYVVTVPLPDGRKVSWEAKHKDLIPMAVAVGSGSAYVLASPSCATFQKLGSPEPPFILFKYEGTRWIRTTIDEFPEGITEANLLIATDGLRAVNEFDKGVVTAKAVKRLNEGNSMRYIYRQGIDKYLWAACGKADTVRNSENRKQGK